MGLTKSNVICTYRDKIKGFFKRKVLCTISYNHVAPHISFLKKWPLAKSICSQLIFRLRDIWLEFSVCLHFVKKTKFLKKSKEENVQSFPFPHWIKREFNIHIVCKRVFLVPEFIIPWNSYWKNVVVRYLQRCA